MPRRNRLYLFAVGGLIAVLAEPSLSYAQHPTPKALSQPEESIERFAVPKDNGDNKGAPQAGDNGPAKGADGAPSAPAPSAQIRVEALSGEAEQANASQECDAQCQRDKDDLQAQENMANAAWAMFAAAIGSLIVTAVGVFLIWKTLIYSRDTLKAANDTVSVTRDIGEAQIRAYLSVINSVMNVRADGRGPETKLSIKNFGNSPAKKVHIIYRIAISRDYTNLRTNGNPVIPPWEQIFEESIASGRTHEFNHFHGDLPFTQEEMELIAAKKTPPFINFYATLQIRFLDVFDRENSEIQHRTAMLQEIGVDMPFFQTQFHELSWKIDGERAAAQAGNAQDNQRPN